MRNHTKIKMLSNEEAASFCAQMASILGAGISTLEGISLLREDAPTKEEQRILTTVYEALLTTGTLSSALTAAAVFPAHLVKMTALGEKTGRLDDLMQSMNRYYERKADTAAAIRHAVTYPAVMVLMLVAVITVLITRVLPVFDQAFAQMGAEMNPAAQLLLEFGRLLSRYAVVLAVLLGAAGLLILFFAKTGTGRRLTGHFFAALPFAGKTALQSAACQFAGVLSLSVHSGFPTEEALSVAAEMNQSAPFSRKIDHCRTLLSQGMSFADALVHAGIFSGTDARMLKISAKTGCMDRELDRIADRLEDQLQSRIARMLSTIEPAIIVVLSVITGSILLSVMLPLLGILSAF